MPPHLPPELARAHVLGKPFEILGHVRPTVIVQCQCDAKTVLVLNGVQSIGTCPACLVRFLITKDAAIEVGAMRPELSGIVQ